MRRRDRGARDQLGAAAAGSLCASRRGDDEQRARRSGQTELPDARRRSRRASSAAPGPPGRQAIARRASSDSRLTTPRCGDHHALGPAGGAGGVDDVGGVVRAAAGWRGRRRSGRVRAGCRVWSWLPVSSRTRCGRRRAGSGGSVGVGEDQDGAGVGRACRRSGRPGSPGRRQVGAAGLEHREQRDDEVDRAAAARRPRAAPGRRRRCDQLPGQPVGPRRRARRRSARSSSNDHATASGRARHLRLEQLGQGTGADGPRAVSFHSAQDAGRARPGRGRRRRLTGARVSAGDGSRTRTSRSAERFDRVPVEQVGARSRSRRASPRAARRRRSLAEVEGQVELGRLVAGRGSGGTLSGRAGPVRAGCCSGRRA